MFNPHSPQTANQDQTSGRQCDLCREGEELEAVTIAVMLLLAEDKTSGALPDETNAALSLPDAETTVPQKKLPEFSFQALKAGGAPIR